MSMYLCEKKNRDTDNIDFKLRFSIYESKNLDPNPDLYYKGSKGSSEVRLTYKPIPLYTTHILNTSWASLFTR